MNKKIKMVLWIVIALAVLALIGNFCYRMYLANTEEIVHPQVSFEIENYGIVKMELYPEYAPNTVANIIKLVEKGYYNNKVIYGKDEVCLYVGRNSAGEAENPKASLLNEAIEADSDNDFEYTIKGEFLANGYKDNTLNHQKGVVSLMRSDYTQYFSELAEESYNSGNAQIGILMEDTRALNGMYTGFAKVIEGLDVLEKIYNEHQIKVDEEAEETHTHEDGTDHTEEEGGIEEFEGYPVIKSATVDTFGVDYGMPQIDVAFDYDAYMNEILSQYYSTTEE